MTNAAPLKYGKDEYDKEILTTEDGAGQVMMEWELPYMEALIDRLAPRGDVLEIGFGLGYSADAIQRHGIRSHTIIECDEGVLGRAREWAAAQEKETRIVAGTWQEMLPALGSFDSFFFDDYAWPVADPENVRALEFYLEIMRAHTNTGARFTFYLGTEIVWPCSNDVSWDAEPFEVEIPPNCDYVPEDLRKSGRMYLPLVIFKRTGIGMKVPESSPFRS